MLQVAVSSFLQSNLQRGGKMSVGQGQAGKQKASAAKMQSRIKQQRPGMPGYQ